MLSPTPDQIRRYQDVYRQEFCREIPFDVAQRKATILLNLVQVLYKPVLVKDLKEADKWLATLPTIDQS